MKEKLFSNIHKLKLYWKERTRKQKTWLISSFIIIIVLVIVLFVWLAKTDFSTLYTDLSMQEANQIKSELDAKGVPYELENNGTTIRVPEEKKDDLLIELAGEGIPNSGNIDYSFFSENTSWGITDNEFSIMKLDAMQTELANLMKGVEGINDAQVMINIPEEPVFVREELEEASASIVLHTEPGYTFEKNQMKALQTLIEKAIPNLPSENIAIMNQYFEYFDQDETNDLTSPNHDHTYQQAVKKEVERDIQKRVQQMLGAIVGRENVIVSVTTDIDFTKENRVEELIEPVDEENMEGLPVSVERIQESYTGMPQENGGIAGAGEEDVVGYQGVEEGEDGDYELEKETINSEFNRIKREIVESPYKIRDLGIQVAVNNVRDKEGRDVTYLSQEDQLNVEEGIQSILDSIATTTIDASYEEVEDDVEQEQISITFQEFRDSNPNGIPASDKTPVWLYFVAGALILLLIGFLFIQLRRSKSNKRDRIEESSAPAQTKQNVQSLPLDEDADHVIQEKQIEEIAKDKPEEFAKLLRSWIGDE